MVFSTLYLYNVHNQPQTIAILVLDDESAVKENSFVELRVSPTTKYQLFHCKNFNEEIGFSTFDNEDLKQQLCVHYIQNNTIFFYNSNILSTHKRGEVIINYGHYHKVIYNNVDLNIKNKVWCSVKLAKKAESLKALNKVLKSEKENTNVIDKIENTEVMLLEDSYNTMITEQSEKQDFHDINSSESDTKNNESKSTSHDYPTENNNSSFSTKDTNETKNTTRVIDDEDTIAINDEDTKLIDDKDANINAIEMQI
ncbi:uncharacterized protein VNE69_02225 [Vairimorpha necatrix]|uniref:Uncharacterized protein n=1 Tax=Vairimorpha necatrix TaxID=6039 RepID=A0AAX4J9S6_9MICR